MAQSGLMVIGSAFDLEVGKLAVQEGLINREQLGQALTDAKENGTSAVKRHTEQLANRISAYINSPSDNGDGGQ